MGQQTSYMPLIGVHEMHGRFECDYITYMILIGLILHSLPHTHAQRGKVIGFVVVVIVVVVVVIVVSTKIARSRILGEFTSATCS